MKKSLVFILLALPFSGWAQSVDLFVGTYTSHSASKGIYAVDFNTNTGDLRVKTSIDAVDPSFLARKDHIIYAVSEQEKGKGSISSYNYTGGAFTLLNTVPSKGGSPCHVAVSPHQNLLVASNYSGGSFIAYRLESNGVIGEQVDLVKFEGKGLDKVRQEGPHVHSAFFSKKGDKLFVQDLGLDQLSIYPVAHFNKAEVKLGSDPLQVFTPAGGGPRHIAFDKNEKYLYVVLEMTAEVAVFKRDGEDWLFHQTIAINAENFSGEDGASEVKISPDGKFLYAANRGTANTIGIFAIAKDGLLTKVGNQSSKGIGPRSFNLSPDGKFLLVANQQSNTIVVFLRDSKTGLLNETGKQLAIPAPVSLIF